MPIWTNSDGLQVRFNLDRVTSAPDGITSAEESILVYDLVDATTLGDTDTAAVADDASFIPAGALIKDAYFVATTDFTSGSSATLDIGLKQASGTNISADGIDADVALAALDEDDVVVCNGALIGTIVSTDAYPMFTYETGAYTAGAGTLIVKFVKFE